MGKQSRSELLRDLQELRESQMALVDRLRRILTAMAMSEEVIADRHLRLDAIDERSNGHRDGALAALDAAHMYRQFLSNFTERVGNG